MTVKEMMDELWEEYAWVSHWKPDGTGVNMMDHEPFKSALKEALQRQRQGCADAWGDAYVGKFVPSFRKKIRKVIADSWQYQDILNAPPKGE